jgi:putative transposase
MDGPCVTPATSYLLGVSTRRMEKLVEQLGINGLSKSQVSVMAKDPQRPSRGGPHPATGCRPVHLPRRRDDEGAGGRSGGQRRLPGRDRGQSHGHREILGVEVRSAESEASWLQFFRGLNAPSGAILPGAAWQRCRTHYAAKLYPVPPASMFLETTSSVFCSSAVGLNSTTSVPAYSVGRCPGRA